MNKQSPRAVWNQATGLRKADPQALLFLMQSRGLYKVTGNGVSFTVGNETLHYGAAAQQLDPYRGREVFITVDGGDLSRCFAFTADRKRFIAELANDEGISPLATVDDLREASANVGRRRKRFIYADREAPQRMRSVSQELRAKSRERAAERRATGTDNLRPVNVEPALKPVITPVRTGFEGISMPVRRAVESATEALGFDLASLASVPNVERESPLAFSMDDLFGTVAPQDGGAEDDGTEADAPREDGFRLLIGDRHESRPATE